MLSNTVLRAGRVRPIRSCRSGGGGILVSVADLSGVHNEASGGLRGPVVQAGSIDHLSLCGPAHVGSDQAELLPRQLPLAIRDFTGRAEQVTALDALLADNAGAGRGAVVISAVDGTAGIGKTTLAVWWAHRVQDRFPHGTLYANLRGYGPDDPATASEVLDGFLRGLGIPGGAIPHGVDAQAGLFRSVLAGRQVLVVLDNAHSADQVRPLLPGTPGCVVVVTSRDSLTGLVVTEGAHRLTLDLLTPHEAHDLVASIVGPQRTAAEPDAVATLIRLCVRLPLALRIAASRAAGPHTTIAAVVAALADERYRLDTLSWGEDKRAALQAVFDWSYQRLAPGQAHLFRHLSLHPGPEISAHAAAALADVDLGEARRLLAALAEAHLIEPTGPARYRFHDLLRAYATHQAHHDPDQRSGERDQALDRVLRWYAWHATTAHQLVYSLFVLPAQNAVLKAATPTDPEITFTTPAHAIAWFDAETVNLAAAVRAADQANRHQLVILLAQATVIAFQWAADRATELDIHRRARAAAHHVGDRAVEVHALLAMGFAHLFAGHWREATDVYVTALGIARDLGDAWLEAWALNDLGMLHIQQRQYARALEYLRAALPLSIGAQNGRTEGVIESNISTACTGLGDFQQALRHAERDLTLRQRADDRAGEAFALSTMALARQAMGEHPEAIALCEQALDIKDYRQYLPEVALTLDRLGTSLHHIGDRERACACWRDAVTIYDKFKDHRAEDLRHRLHSFLSHGPAPSHVSDRHRPGPAA